MRSQDHQHNLFLLSNIMWNRFFGSGNGTTQTQTTTVSTENVQERFFLKLQTRSEVVKDARAATQARIRGEMTKIANTQESKSLLESIANSDPNNMDALLEFLALEIIEKAVQSVRQQMVESGEINEEEDKKIWDNIKNQMGPAQPYNNNNNTPPRQHHDARRPAPATAPQRPPAPPNNFGGHPASNFQGGPSSPNNFHPLASCHNSISGKRKPSTQ